MSTVSSADRLCRKLNWIDATAIFVGIILGSGIFEAPATVAAAAPGLGMALTLWLVGALVAACGAFCYAECGARLPHTGGFYIYFREAYGEGAAFVGGWVALLITYPASIAAIAHILARYVGQLVPQVAASETASASVAAGAVLIAGTLNILGVRAGAYTQRALTGFKVLALGVLCVAAIALPGQARASPPPTADLPMFPAGLGAVLTAMVILLWTYDGWSDVTLIGGELRDPGRDFGRTVMLGIAILAGLYVLVQVAVVVLLPPAQAAASKQVIADAVAVSFGQRAASLVALLVVVSTFGSINGIVLTASRLGFAMANDGVFLRFFSRVTPRFETPARSIVALIGGALLYVLVADFRNLLAFFSFNVWIFYATTAVALLVLRRRQRGEPPAWRAPLGPLAPIVVLGTALGMTASLMAQDPLRSLIGLAMLSSAVPVYLLWRAWRQRGAALQGGPTKNRDGE
jgi:APA family basic amino acid/polyamine antiporter